MKGISIAEHIIQKYGLNPYEYMTFGVATDSIGSDLNVLQIVLIYKDSLYRQYIQGGDPRKNFEFTHIPYDEYCAKAVPIKTFISVVNEIFGSDSPPMMSVVNTRSWMQKAFSNTGSDIFNIVSSRTSMFALSQYEKINMLSGRSLDEWVQTAPNLVTAFSQMNKDCNTLPPTRIKFTSALQRRGIMVPVPKFKEERLYSKCEQQTYHMHLLAKAILDNTPEAEKKAGVSCEEDEE